MLSIRSDALSYHETATGNYHLPRDARGDIVARSIRTNRVYDAEVVEIARRYIRPGSVVLDVGANFGQMSVLFSNCAGPDGKVYAFEADEFVADILARNIEANGRAGRIVPVPGAVHDEAGQTLFFPVQDFVRFDSYGSYGVDYNARGGREVRSLTIDSLEIAEPVSFMKIDIQGGDLLAMRGAERTIARNRMPIVFEYEYLFEEEFGLCFQDYVDFVRRIGYRFHKVVNGQNYLIVPDDSAPARRGREAG